MTQPPGLFISFEGGEGTGKTTQIKLLTDALKVAGHSDVVVTREPGGMAEAEKIRDLLVRREGGNWSPMAEALLLFAGRVMHVDSLIKPALDDGKIVICDRFVDSTRAYQGYGGDLSIDMIEKLNGLVLGDFSPDLTFVMDLPVEIGLERAGKRLAEDSSDEDRFENLDISFHEKLRQGYLEIAKGDSNRCVVIDAARSIEEIAEELKTTVLKKLEAHDVKHV